MSIIHYRDQQCDELREEWVPVRILRSHNVTGLEELTSQKAASVSFQVNHCAHWQGAGSWVLMDFGRELCGGVRIITRGGGNGGVKWGGALLLDDLGRVGHRSLLLHRREKRHQ